MMRPSGTPGGRIVASMPGADVSKAGEHKLAGMVPALWVVYYVNLAVLAITIVVQAIAFVHCLTRRSDAFAVVSPISKGGWSLMTGGALVFTFLSGGATFLRGTSNFLYTLIALAGFVVAAVYLLDIRPALHDAVDGRGNW
jgi:hypothetical protein